MSEKDDDYSHLQWQGASPGRTPPDPRLETSLVGVSLRDWFAGQALMAMGTLNPHLPGDLPDEPWPEPALLVRRRAIWAYLHADAMLAEREKART